MHKCVKCGSQVKAGAKFCPECGTPVVSIQPEYIANIEILKKKIENDSLNPNLYIELGSVYQKGNLLQEALVEFQKAINIDDSIPDAHLKSGNIYLELRDYAKAIVSFQNALDIAPDSVASKIGLFNAFYLQDKMEQALELGEKIIKIEPNNLEVHRTLKEIYVNKELKDKALNSLETILSLAPDDKIALKELATLYVEKDENEKALNCHNRILELDPSDSEGLFFKGKHYLTKGKYQKTIDYLEKIIQELSPELEAYAHLYLASAYVNMKDLDSAKREISRVSFPDITKLSDNDKKLIADVNMQIGSDYEENRQWKYAKKHYFDALNVVLNNEECRNRLDVVSKKIKGGKRKISIAILGIAIIIIAALSILYFGKGKISFKVNTEANITILRGDKLVAQYSNVNMIASGFLRFGGYNVKIEKPGYATIDREISIGFGRKIYKDSIAIFPNFGSLVINTNPSKAKVFLDNQYVDTTPLKLDSLLAKSTMIKIEKKGYNAYEKEHIIVKGQILDLGLINFMGSLKVDSHPSGAYVYIDGKDYGKTPVQIKGLKAKSIELKMEKPGIGIYRNNSIHLKPEEILDLGIVDLKPAGSLRIISVPKGANVYTDGLYLGTTPVFVNTIQEGDCTLKFAKRFYNTSYRKVTIIGQDTATAHINLKQFEGTWKLKHVASHSGIWQEQQAPQVWKVYDHIVDWAVFKIRENGDSLFVRFIDSLYVHRSEWTLIEGTTTVVTDFIVTLYGETLRWASLCKFGTKENYGFKISQEIKNEEIWTFIVNLTEDGKYFTGEFYKKRKGKGTSVMLFYAERVK